MESNQNNIHIEGVVLDCNIRELSSKNSLVATLRLGVGPLDETKEGFALNPKKTSVLTTAIRVSGADSTRYRTLVEAIARANIQKFKTSRKNSRPVRLGVIIDAPLRMATVKGESVLMAAGKHAELIDIANDTEKKFSPDEKTANKVSFVASVSDVKENARKNTSLLRLAADSGNRSQAVIFETEIPGEQENVYKKGTSVRVEGTLKFEKFTDGEKVKTVNKVKVSRISPLSQKEKETKEKGLKL